MNDVLLLAVLQSLDAGDVDTARGLADLAGDDAAIETLLAGDVAESVQGPKGPPPFEGAVFDTGRHRWVKVQQDESGSRYGAGVTIGDETGVPVEDTAYRFNRSGLKAAGDVFWSREKDYAEEFGNEVSGGIGTIENGTVKLNNPIHILAKPSQFSDPSFENPIIKKAKEDGHDGAIFDSPENGDRFYVIFGGTR